MSQDIRPGPGALRAQRQMEFDVLSKKVKPKPKLLRNVLLAYLVGGAICMIAQIINNVFIAFGAAQAEAGARTAVAMIFIGALMTGLGIYDQLGRYAGAGSAIPITGFANTVVAPAIEFAQEGFILGMAAQIFTVAGPVIVYGLVSAVVSAGLRYVLGL